ncbi:MAG: TrkH family potassium uptake protein [bacterium]
MNWRRVLHILGLVLFVLAAAELVPLVWALEGGEGRALLGFSSGAALAAFLGGVFRWLGSREGELYRRDGVLIVVGAWVMASLVGAIPYLVSGVLPSPADALFESASGFTTTGASVLTDIEAAGRPMLFWRSLTQWLGGIGIVVLFVALLSELGPGARFLFKLEVPGPKAEIMHERVRDTALALGRIYLLLSGLLVVSLLLCGASLFDALTHTFSTVSTGGFSPHSESAAIFSPVGQMVLIVFMLAAGVNFSLYFFLIRSRDLRALRDAELRLYLILMAAATGLVTVSLYLDGGEGLGGVLLDAAFQVVSITTTTGFATADFSHWPTLSQALLLGAMVLGGCAGSTSGGAKILRGIIGWRAAMREVRLVFSPNSVIAVVAGREAVPEESVRSVVALLVLWFLAWGLGALLLSIGDFGIVTAATASIATLSNIGPGLGPVGPAGNFAFFAPWQKLVMVLLMWLGRLEFFALLALFQRRFWRP